MGRLTDLPRKKKCQGAAAKPDRLPLLPFGPGGFHQPSLHGP